MAAALAALNAAPAARASVVFTAANLPVDSGHTDQGIDLNHDGITDVDAEYGAADFPFTEETNLKVVNTSYTDVAVDTGSNGEGASNVVAFSAGDTIGPTLPGSDSYSSPSNFGGGNLYTPAQSYGLVTQSDDPGSGNYPASANEKFIGLQFFPTGTSSPIDYGYIAFQTTNDSSTTSLAGTVLGYAYETQPGVPIIAGAVPEPGSLALLAMGAAGLGRYRRRTLR